jgi:hypothetical protein
MRSFVIKWCLSYVVAIAVALWSWKPWLDMPMRDHLLHLSVSLVFLVVLFMFLRRQSYGTFGESENNMPGWRRKAREALKPYRRVAGLVVLAVIVLSWCNSFFDWRLLGVIFRRNGASGFSAYRSQAVFGIKEPLPD